MSVVNWRNFDKLNFLSEVRNLAEHKGFSFDTVIKAVEEVLRTASCKRYGNYSIEVEVDKKTGGLSVYRKLKVVEDRVKQSASGNTESETDDEDGYDLIPLSEALVVKPDAKAGDKILYPLPLEFDESSQRLARRKMAQIIKLEEQRKQYEEHKDRVGEIVYGVVKNAERDGVVVDLNGVEGFVPRSGLVEGERFRHGDKIKAYVENVVQANSGYQIFLSRTHKEFVAQLFKNEVPEIADGVVSIKVIARDPGSRSKVAVFSSDKNIDPVGSCVGIKGSRVRGIIAELCGEKIDIIPYSSDLAKFVVSAIAPAEVSKVIIDEDANKIELVIPENQLSLAIGRRGQNIRLASDIVGWNISVLSDVADSARRNEEFVSTTKLLMETLSVEEIIGQLLVAEGFMSAEDIFESSAQDLIKINGFNDKIVEELQRRAGDYLSAKQQKDKESAEASELDFIKGELPFLQAEHFAVLRSNGIKSVEDIAALSRDEFFDLITDSGLDVQQVDNFIIEARKKVGWL